MKISVILIIVIIANLFTQCRSGSVENAQIDIIDFIEDSTSIFNGVTQFIVNGELQGSKATLKFYSISEDSFRSAIRENVENIRLFNRKYKVNENLGIKNCFRKDSLLVLESANNQIKLIDQKEGFPNRAQSYFLEDKIGAFFVVKWVGFEDAGIMFLNSNTLEVELSLKGLTTYTNRKDSLVFYISPMRDVFIEENDLCLLQLRLDNSMDTLLFAKTRWFPDFAFFDNSNTSLYYIHSFYDNYELKSTYAKMEIETY
jgi:hypothetical protein